MSKLFKFPATTLNLITFRDEHRALAIAAFPDSKVDATELLLLFNELEDTKNLIVMAKKLELIYFGFGDPDPEEHPYYRHCCILNFANKELLNRYIEERYLLIRANSVNQIRVESKKQAYFCQQFWSSLLNDTLVTRAVSKGFTLEYLEKRKLRLEQKFNKVSQGEVTTFEMIIQSCD